MVILWSDKVDFRAKRERKSLGNGKGSLQQEDIAFLNVYETNGKAGNMEVKTKIKKRNRYSTILVEDFNTSLNNW